MSSSSSQNNSGSTANEDNNDSLNSISSINPTSLLSLAGFMGANSMRNNSMTHMPGLNHMRHSMTPTMGQNNNSMINSSPQHLNSSAGGGNSNMWMTGNSSGTSSSSSAGSNSSGGPSADSGHGGGSGGTIPFPMWGDMAESLLERGRSKNWTYEETMELINTYTSEEWQNKFSSEKKNHRAIWTEMAEVLKKREGVTGDEARQRLNNLKALYNRIRRQLIAGEVAAPQWEYWDSLHSFLSRPSQYGSFGLPRDGPSPMRVPSGLSPPNHGGSSSSSSPSPYPPMQHMAAHLHRPSLLHSHPRMGAPHHMMGPPSQQLHMMQRHAPDIQHLHTSFKQARSEGSSTPPVYGGDHPHGGPGPSGPSSQLHHHPYHHAAGPSHHHHHSPMSGEYPGIKVERTPSNSSKAPQRSSYHYEEEDCQQSTEEVSDGAGSSSIGMSGIEAVVAAAAAAAVAAGDSDGGSGAALSGRHERQSPAAQGSSKPESYQLRHNNHLSLVLNQLAEDEAFMDVTLTAQGRNVKAHKSVLSAVSPYFSEVLKANPCQHPIVILPRDIRFSELNSIIMYIYRGEVTVAAEDLPSLLKTAELLNVTGLSPRDNNNSSDDNSTSKMASSHGANNSSSISGGYTTTTSTSHHHQSTSRSSTLKHSKQSNERSSERTTNSSSSMSGQSLGSPSHTLINPTDFMDLDMTCVKEEMQSGDEEEDPMESTTPKEVTTPPPIENPFLTSSKELSEASSSVTAFNSTDSSKADSGGTSSSGPNTPTTDNNSNAADNTRSDNQEFEQLEQNSLKTLASLASLNTPTSNLSPAPDNNSNSSSPALPASSLDEPSPNICPYCSLYFPTPELSTHLSSKHSFKAAFLCSDCARVYTRKNSFDQHSKSCSSKNNTS